MQELRQGKRIHFTGREWFQENLKKKIVSELQLLKEELTAETQRTQRKNLKINRKDLLCALCVSASLRLCGEYNRYLYKKTINKQGL